MANETDLKMGLVVVGDENKRLKKQVKAHPKYIGNVGRTLTAIGTGIAIGAAQGIANEKAPTVPAGAVAASGLAVGGLVTCALVENADVAAVSNEVANAALAIGAYGLSQLGIKAAADAAAKMKADNKPDTAKK